MVDSDWLLLKVTVLDWEALLVPIDILLVLPTQWQEEGVEELFSDGVTLGTTFVVVLR